MHFRHFFMFIHTVRDVSLSFSVSLFLFLCRSLSLSVCLCLYFSTCACDWFTRNDKEPDINNKVVQCQLCCDVCVRALESSAIFQLFQSTDWNVETLTHIFTYSIHLRLINFSTNIIVIIDINITMICPAYTDITVRIAHSFWNGHLTKEVILCEDLNQEIVR